MAQAQLVVCKLLLLQVRSNKSSPWFWMILKLFRNWRSNTVGRRGSNSCKLLASVLRCADRPMLSSRSWTEGKACLPKIVLIVLKKNLL